MEKKLKLALVQSPLIWEDPCANRIMFDGKLDSISADVDLIVLPEMFTTGFTMSPQSIDIEEGQKTVAWMKQKAKDMEAALMGSIVFYENGTYSNRIFFIEPDGKTSTYDKRHTFTLSGEDKAYKAGDKRLIIDYKDFRICPMICYDLRFPVWVRYTEDYDVLIFVANWPKPRIAAWDTLLKARAIENMAYCIGVNRIGTDEEGHEYSGNSGVYDCLGSQIAFSREEEIIYASLSKDHITATREKLKFLEDRDSFTLKG